MSKIPAVRKDDIVWLT